MQPGFVLESSIEFIDARSREIFNRKEHVLVGISPFNSYYSEENIEKILAFVIENRFKNFHVFLADEMSFYNLLALGYDEKEAWAKTRKRDRNLRNKTLRVFEKLNISEEHLLKNQTLINNPKYPILFEKYAMVEGDSIFRDILFTVMDELHFEGEYNKIIHREIGMKYFIAELPILLNCPELFNVASSIFMYCSIGALHQDLYTTKKIQANNQGFMKIQF